MTERTVLNWTATGCRASASLLLRSTSVIARLAPFFTLHPSVPLILILHPSLTAQGHPTNSLPASFPPPSSLPWTQHRNYLHASSFIELGKSTRFLVVCSSWSRLFLSILSLLLFPSSQHHHGPTNRLPPIFCARPIDLFRSPILLDSLFYLTYSRFISVVVLGATFAFVVHEPVCTIAPGSREDATRSAIPCLIISPLLPSRAASAPSLALPLPPAPYVTVPQLTRFTAPPVSEPGICFHYPLSCFVQSCIPSHAGFDLPIEGRFAHCLVQISVPPSDRSHLQPFFEANLWLLE